MKRLGDQSWRRQAACLGLDPDIFFPFTGESDAEARAVCATCVVTAECLEHALTAAEYVGIWGGTSERQRRIMRRQRRQDALEQAS